jgi:hypothetical protein
MRAFLLLLSIALAACTSKGSGSGTSTSTSTTTTSGGGSTAAASVQLTWTASTGSPNGYYVEQSTDGTNFNRVATTATTNALIPNLTVGQTYYFRVRGYNAGGYSAASSVYTVTP